MWEIVPEKEGIEWLGSREEARGERAVVGGSSENGNGSIGKEEAYQVLKATPSHLRVLKEALGEEDAGIAGWLVIGGEALRWEELKYWSSKAPKMRLINEYGPTETVVGSVVYEVGVEREGEGAVPLGSQSRTRGCMCWMSGGTWRRGAQWENCTSEELEWRVAIWGRQG